MYRFLVLVVVLSIIQLLIVDSAKYCSTPERHLLPVPTNKLLESSLPVLT